MGKQQKIVFPPDLPPEVPDDEVEVSDEDFKFVSKRRDYAGFLSKLDTKSITKHVTRVADVKEDALEAMYEKRNRKKSVEKVKDANEIEVDPVDALPVKTLDGKLYYRSAPKPLPKHDGEATDDDEDDEVGAGVTKLSKPEKRAKLKKEKKEAKKQAKAVTQSVEVEHPWKAELLDEVKKEITAEEAIEKKKYKLAELGTALLVDPESNIKSLKEMLEISKDGNQAIVILGLKSMLAVFKDIIPGYRIRLPTEKEQEMMVSKAVKQMRLYEYTLLSSYKAYIQKLISVENQAVYKRVAIRCLCHLLEAVPHFNFRETLVAAVVRNISSPDDVVRKQCCDTVKSLFLNEGKHGGEATLEAVGLIADLVKAYDCQLHPDSVEVFMSLSFDEDLVKALKEEKNSKTKSYKKKRKFEDQQKKGQENDKKRSKQEMISQTREEVKSDYKAASFAQDAAERGKMQTVTLSAVFQTFFRILKHAMLQPRSEAKTEYSYGKHPLLAPCLNGIGKFSHLIDLDFMPDLMNHLKKLAESGHNNLVDDSSSANFSRPLTVSERLQCCIVAFKVMKNNLDALNVDLQDFYVQLYCLILEYRPGRDKGEVLCEALKIMLCDGRLHDMQRAAAFIKRLATFSLCFGSAESMAALVTLNHLLLKNTKCRNLLENDEGGGSVIGGFTKYQPYASDPNLSGALGSVLWELNLLSKHYHPDISKLATGISTMNTANNEVFHSNFSPQQAFKKLSFEQESFVVPNVIKGANTKRKKGSSNLASSGTTQKVDYQMLDSDKIAGKLSDHFILHDIGENERLRWESDRINLSLNLYKEFKNLKKRKTN